MNNSDGGKKKKAPEIIQEKNMRLKQNQSLPGGQIK